MEEDIIICRCEEITLGEIKQAIAEGATDITGIKRRTRAGMGLCQGRTCEQLIERILQKELNKKPDDIKTATIRPPVRTITFGTLGGDNR